MIMSHKPIQFTDVSLVFPHKICFEGFTTSIAYGSRIAVTGRNGSGKSTLLRMIYGDKEPSNGTIKLPENVRIGYLPQIIEDHASASGAQRLNKALTQALASDPNILLLDEPSNHLDLANRKSLFRLLNSYTGTLLIVSHDVELLENCVDTIWHITDGRISIFSGNYQDYQREIAIKRKSLSQEIVRVERQRKDMHQALMQEQARAAKSRAQGEKSIDKRKWPTIVSKTKAMRGGQTAGRKKAEINMKKQELSDKLSEMRLPEIIKPKFQLPVGLSCNQTVLNISEASAGYQDHVILENISLSLSYGERLAIIGPNASGKSTLVKAILSHPEVKRTGNWYASKSIGYLDQHYHTLMPHKTVLETIQELLPSWQHSEIRRFLNDFLFRKNEEVNACVSTLSGGEKARLSLAQIAARPPQLLILDEITNNLDLETREHVINVLKEYTGALIVISHDENFLKAINITQRYIL
jgi:ATPase subunit of ABC transporter with duplicated ATPase domains